MHIGYKRHIQANSIRKNLKEWTKVHQASRNNEKAQAAILISDKVEFYEKALL